MDDPSPPLPRSIWSSHAKISLAVAVIIIAVSIAAGLRYHQDHKALAPKYKAAVSLSGQGLTPAVLSVKAGTLVTWTNTDKQPHEIAADPYPKNNSIPGFESTVVLQTNDSYSFTFGKSGTYHYHDQLNPFKINGTVIVK